MLGDSHPVADYNEPSGGPLTPKPGPSTPAYTRPRGR
jgi:hypothetical protein